MRELALALILMDLGELRHIRRNHIIQGRYFESIEIVCCCRNCLLLLLQSRLVEHVDLKLMIITSHSRSNHSVSSLYLRLLFGLLPIFNQYSRLLLSLLRITLSGTLPAAPIREPTTAPLLGRPIMMRRLGPPPEHLHLQEAFLLIVDQPLKLLLHLDLVAQLAWHLRVWEKRGTHHLTRCVRGIWTQIGLHHYFVVFEGAGLQVSDVNFPSFRALCACI
jgi:hypothetical protein